MDRRLILISSICLAASLLMDSALADGHWYGGVGVGSTRYTGLGGTHTIAPGTFNPAGFSSTFNSSDSATAWSLDLGYRFNTYFALEGGYTYFGSVTGISTTTTPNTRFAVETKVRGETLDALGILPVGGGFTLFAKAGLLHYRSDRDEPLIFALGTTPPTVQSVVESNSSTTGTTPDVGIGASYAVTERFSVRAGVTYFRGKRNSTTATGFPVLEMPGIHLRYVQFVCSF